MINNKVYVFFISIILSGISDPRFGLASPYFNILTCESSYFSENKIDSIINPFVPKYSIVFKDKNGKDDTIQMNVQIPYRIKIDGKEITLSKLMNDVENELELASNAGFPFAQIHLMADSISIDTVVWLSKSYLQLDKILFTKPTVEGNVKISLTFLEKFTGLEVGTPFSMKKLNSAYSKLNTLSFIRQQRLPSWTVFNRKATPIWFLTKKNANKIDGVLGVAPNSQTFGKDKFAITGSIQMDLYNLLSLADYFGVFYRHIPNGTREFKAEIQLPYLINLPFGISGLMRFYKQDTTFSETDLSLGFVFYHKENIQFKVNYHFKNSGLIGINSNLLIRNRKLPASLDYKSNGLGIGFKYFKLDNFFNPTKGYSTELNIAANIKITEKNGAIASLKDLEGNSLGILYDSLNLNSGQMFSTFSLKYFLPIKQNFVLYTGTSFGYMLSSGQIYDNEKFRIGGILSLRGFDEQQFPLTAYTIVSVENRVLTGKNSHWFLGLDLSYLKFNSVNSTKTASLSLGTRFETQAGVFSLSYALGLQEGDRINFSNGKIHFGYSSLF